MNMLFQHACPMRYAAALLVKHGVATVRGVHRMAQVSVFVPVWKSVSRLCPTLNFKRLGLLDAPNSNNLIYTSRSLSDGLLFYFISLCDSIASFNKICPAGKGMSFLTYHGTLSIQPFLTEHNPKPDTGTIIGMTF